MFGGEADFQWTGLEGDFDGNIDLSSSLDPSATAGLNLSAGSEVDWYGTLRLRAGWLITDQFLAYATGGAAYGKVKSSYSLGLNAFGDGDRVQRLDVGQQLGLDPWWGCRVPDQRIVELQG